MQAVITGVISIMLAVCVPAMLLPSGEEIETKKVVVIRENYDDETREKPSILLRNGTKTEEILLEDYLVGVVLAEMPPSFHEEALKAQAVAARTYSIYKIQRGKHTGYDLCANSACCQAWIDYESLEPKFGDDWKAYYEKAKNAVLETENEVITYQGELIEAVYFSCSAGRTENAAAVWGNDVPYLQSVDSDGEETSSKYKSEVKYDDESFKAIALEENEKAVFSEKRNDWIGEVLYTTGEGVNKIQIGEQWYTGTQIRRIYKLNSTKFSIAYEDDGVVFEVYGYGHRVGMSQYGANAMANEGKEYREILMHYYTDIDVKKLDQMQKADLLS